MSVAVVVANVVMVFALETSMAAPPTASAPEAAPAPAPVLAAPKAEILGLWKGTSTCAKVDGNEFCRDETIVYNFVDVPSQPATVGLKAARIVDGAMVRTFDLYFTYRPETGRWTSEFDRDGARAEWSYVVSGDTLTGMGMLLSDRKIVRNVTAKRTAKDAVLTR